MAPISPETDPTAHGCYGSSGIAPKRRLLVPKAIDQTLSRLVRDSKKILWVGLRMLGKTVEALEVFLGRNSIRFLQRTVPLLYLGLLKEVFREADPVGHKGGLHVFASPFMPES
jgi:hypothetical protein